MATFYPDSTSKTIIIEFPVTIITVSERETGLRSVQGDSKRNWLRVRTRN